MATSTSTPRRRTRTAVAEGRRRASHGWERLSSWFMYNNAGFWRVVRKTPVINSWVNRAVIDWLSTRTISRPTPLSLWGPNQAECVDYPSWASLADRTFTGRHLPPRPADDPAPPSEDKVCELFKRHAVTSPCPKSTALFCFFAQWFTDSFLRTDFGDNRKNTSNHEIDLCQIYGLCPGDTAILRMRDGSGKLRSQVIPATGEEYPCYLFEPDGKKVRPEFHGLSYINSAGTDFRIPILQGKFDTQERRSRLFAAGLERGSSTIFYSAINTVFLREHNQICDILHVQNPLWDDNRLFETARNINIAQLIKIIVEDYINHISPAKFRVFFEPGFAECKRWYRANRIAAEFNLLYRWHSLVPTTFKMGGQPMPDTDFRFNDRELVNAIGLEKAFTEASTQSAGRISLKNTPEFLWEAELRTLQKGRAWRLCSFNDYREQFQLPPLGSFEELVDDKCLAEQLRKIYTEVDNVELMVGLLAEKRHVDDALFGNLMTYMVGVDAFTQALTNPLLSSNLFNAGTFTEEGLSRIMSTSTFAQVVDRNIRPARPTVSFTIAAKDPPREWRLPWRFGRIQDYIGLHMFLGWESYFRKRRRRFGTDVFGVNLYQPTLVVLNGEAMQPLFDSPDFIQDYGFGWAKPDRKLVGTVPSIFESGPAHDGPKALYLELLALKRPTLESTLERVADKHIDDWLAKGTVCLREELEDFAADFLVQWFLETKFPSKKLRLIYTNIFSHFFFPAVLALFPCSTYARSLKARDDWIKCIHGSSAFQDKILSLAAKQGLHDEDAVADQMAFVIGMNSFLGTQNLLKSVVAEVAALDPKWRDMCRDGKTPPGSNMPAIDLVLSETLRMHPPVTFIFGRTLNGRPLETPEGRYNLRGGELVMGVLPFAMRDAKIFEEPDTFKPERFQNAALLKDLIWARGPADREATKANRTCAAKDVGPAIARAFVLHLMRRTDWTFETPPEWDAKRFGLDVAAPKGDLKATFKARPAIP